MSGPTEKEGTFLVNRADDGAAVLEDVDDGGVHTLAGNPGLDPRDVLEATLAAEPPMGVTWRVVDVVDRRSLTVVRSDEVPTARARELAADLDVGELTPDERAGTCEVHVHSVPPGFPRRAAAAVVDEATLARAARLGAVRVEVRADDGVVSVRYLT